MNDTHIKTLAQVQAFLEGTHAVAFSLETKTERQTGKTFNPRLPNLWCCWDSL